MSLRRSDSFYYLLSIVFAALTVWIACLAAFEPAPRPLVIRPGAAPEPQGAASLCSVTPPEEVSCCIKCFLDEIVKIGGYLKIRGWAFVERQQSMGQEVYVQIMQPDSSAAHYTTLPGVRPDLGEAFKNPQYKGSGFTALIPLPGRAALDYSKCRLVIKNASGVHKGKTFAELMARPSKEGQRLEKPSPQNQQQAAPVDKH